jgi:WD40 repeat protein
MRYFRRMTTLTAAFVCSAFHVATSDAIARDLRSGKQPPANTAIAPKLVAQVGHTQDISTIAVSPDGRFVATGQERDGLVWLWDIANGRAIGSLGPVKSARYLAFAPDGRRLLVKGHKAQFFDVATGRPVTANTRTAGGYDAGAVFRGDGTVAMCGAGYCSVLDAETWRLRHRFEVNKSLLMQVVAFSPDKSLVAVGFYDGTVSVFRIADGKRLRHWPKAHKGEISSIVFSADGRFVASGGRDQWLRSWRLSDGAETLAFHNRAPRSRSMYRGVRALVAGKGSIIYAAVLRGMIHRFDLSGQSTDPQMQPMLIKRACRGRRSRCRQITGLAISNQGRMLLAVLDANLTSGVRPTVEKIELPSGRNVGAIRGLVNGIEAVRFTKSGHHLLVSAFARSHLFDIDGARVIKTFNHEYLSTRPRRFGDGFVWIAHDPGFRNRQAIHIWSERQGETIHHNFWPPNEDVDQLNLTCLLASADGHTLVLATNRTTAVYTGGHFRPQMVFNIGCSSLDEVHLALSPDAQRLLHSRKSVVTLFDLQSGKRLMRRQIKPAAPGLHGAGNILDIGFSKTGDVAMAHTNNRLLVFDARTGALKEARSAWWDGTARQFTATMSRGTKDAPKIFVRKAARPGEPRRVVPKDWLPLSHFEFARSVPDGPVHILAIALALELETKKFVLLDPDHLDQPARLNDIGHLAHESGRSAAGRFAAASNSIDRVTVWNRHTGDISARFNANISDDANIAFSNNERLLALGDDNGTVSIWNLTTKRKISDLIVAADGQWLVASPDGRYDTNNPGEFAGISWVLPDEPMRALPIELFYREYFEPRLLARLLGGEALRPVRALATLNRIQPEVRIVGIELVAGRSGVVSVTVMARARSGAGLRDLKLFRNGQLVASRPGNVAGTAASGGKLIRFRQIRVSTTTPGPVTFAAYAFNRDGIKSATHRLPWTPPKQQVPAKRRAYVVTIGVNSHDNAAWNLRYAAADARAGREVVAKSLTATGRYEEVVTITLASGIQSDGAPTKANIRQVIDRLAGRITIGPATTIIGLEKLRRAGPDDLVYFAFSGHGFADDKGAFHLFPQDIGKGSDRRVDAALMSRLISAKELSGWLHDVDVGTFVMVIDACNSAASIASAGFKPGPMGSRTLGQLAYDKGMRLLAASQAEAVAFESAKIRHGTLTYALLREGLNAGRADAAPRDGDITIDEWLAFGVRRVPLLHDELRSGAFKPVATRGARPLLSDGANQALRRIQKPILFDFRRRKRPMVLHQVTGHEREPRRRIASKAPLRLPRIARFGFDCQGLQGVLNTIGQSDQLKLKPLPPTAQTRRANAHVWTAPGLIRKFKGCLLTLNAAGVAIYTCKTRLAGNHRGRALARFSALTQTIEQCAVKGWSKDDKSAQFAAGGMPDVRMVLYDNPIKSRRISLIMNTTRGPEDDLAWETTLHVIGKPDK